MVNYTFVYAASLALLGVAGYILTGQESVTALIPAFFAIPFLLLALFARKESLRKHLMHAALLLALLALFGSAGGLASLPGLLSGSEVERPSAVVAQSVMSLLTLVYLALGVRSFIQARKTAAAE